MITYGFISLGNNGIRKFDYSLHDGMLNGRASLNTGLDHYLQYSPAVAAFGMKLGGVESKNGAMDMAIMYAVSNVLNAAAVHGMRQIVPRWRPDGANRKSFPSGHTSTAFVAAEFLHQEYKDQSIWISVGGYGVASLVGVGRMYKNRHWFSDVVMGAGIGILSTKVVYLIYPYFREAIGGGGKRKASALLFPCYSEGNWGVGLSYTF
jgi:membrane-associated phospholipid phosphatase